MIVAMMGFRQHYAVMAENRDIDPVYPMLRAYADDNCLSQSERIWLSVVYAGCDAISTTLLLMRDFPSCGFVSDADLYRWWFDNKHRLQFSDDRRWIKSLNQFPDIVIAFTRLAYEGEAGWFMDETRGCENRFDRYDNLKKCVESGLPHTGRFASFMMLECMNALLDVGIEPATLDMGQCESVANGLCYAVGREDLLHGNHSGTQNGRNRLTATEVAWLNHAFDALLKDTSREFPDGTVNVWTVETALCVYKKYCKGKYLLGHYHDDVLRELRIIEKSFPELDISSCWEWRRQNVPVAFLHEETSTKERMIVC